MKIVSGLGLALVLAIGTAGCVQTADADSAVPTEPTIANFGLPSVDETTTTVAPTPFVASDAGFSAVFPDEPERGAQTVPVGGYEIPLTTYATYGGGRNDGWAMIVGAVDYSVVDDGGVVVAATLDAGLDGAARNIKGRVVSRTPVDLVGAVGLDGTIETDEAVVYVRLIGVGNRMWMLEDVEVAGEPARADYDTLLQTFQVL